MARTSHHAFCSSFDHLLHLPLLLFLHASVRASLSTGARPSHNSCQRKKPLTRKKKQSFRSPPNRVTTVLRPSLPAKGVSSLRRKAGSEMGTREDGVCTPCTWARERTFVTEIHAERGGESRRKKPGGMAGWIPNPNDSRQTGRGVNIDIAKEIEEGMNPMLYAASRFRPCRCRHPTFGSTAVFHHHLLPSR